MSRQSAIVFIERGCVEPISRRAKIAKEKGYQCVYVCRPQDKQLVQPDIFDLVITNEDWSFQNLKTICDHLPYDIKALIWHIGLFHSKGLLGADVARLAEERGLPHQGVDALYRTNNKFLMRDALKTHGIRTVSFDIAEDVTKIKEQAEKIGYPIILKPITGVASSLILKCTNFEELVNNFNLALKRLPHAYYSYAFSYQHEYSTLNGERRLFNPMKSMLMEKYIPGREASVECIVTQGKVIPILVHDKILVTEDKKIVYEHLLVNQPLRFSKKEVDEMKDYAVKVVQAVGLKNCFTHIELRYEDGVGPQLLEINPRIGGLYISKSIADRCGGISAEELSLELKLNARLPEGFSVHESESLNAMFALFPKCSGVLKSVDGLDKVQSLPQVEEVSLKYSIGSVISGDDEECFLIAGWIKGNSLDEVNESYHCIKNQIQFNVVPAV